MAQTLVIALLVTVIALGGIVYSQSKTIKNYEQELIKKARKSKNGPKSK